MAKKKNAKKAARPAAKKGKAKASKAAAKKKSPAKKAKKPARKAAKKAAPVKQERSTSIAPYLTFNGNCEEAFNAYRSVFGGNFTYVGRFKDMPPTDGKPIPENLGNLIMHISLPIGKGSVLMGSDSSEEFGHASVVGNNFSISVTAVSKGEADRIYNALANGGKQTMPMSSTFWGSYFGMLVDRFGIQWMVSFDQNSK